MKSVEISARTTEEAISEGLEKLGVTLSDVTVDILEEGSKGLFGLFGSRPAKVRLTLNEDDDEDSGVKAIFAEPVQAAKSNPLKTQEKKAKKPEASKPVAAEKSDVEAEETSAEHNPEQKKDDKPQKPARKPRPVKEKTEEQPKEAAQPAEPVEIVPAEQVDRATAAGRAQEFLQQVTKLMGVNVAVHVKTDDEGNVRVNMQGDTLGILIGRRGETLDALQYLTSLQVNKGQSEYTRVTLDTENYRARREEALIRLANRMANRAQKTGRKVSMEPMNPYERRILHSALQNNPAVETHSEGEEPNRHVVITLKQK